eukprot:g3631.t1
MIQLHPTLKSLVEYVSNCIRKNINGHAASAFNYSASGITSQRAAVLAVTQELSLTSPKVPALWLGSNDFQRSQVEQWLGMAFNDSGNKDILSPNGVQLIDSALSQSNFLVPGTVAPTLADLAIYWKLIPFFNSTPFTVASNILNLGRWFDQMQHTYRAPLQTQIIKLTFANEGNSSAPADEGKTIANDAKKKNTADDSKNSNKVSKKDKKEKKKKAKKNKPAKNAPAVDENVPGFGKMDIRVGVITKAWHHEASEKLWCEEIDVGEEAPRQIASGLRAFFDESAMVGRRCLVVCNLKARKMAGFKSHGMVLCASSKTEDGEKSKVEFVTPPVNAKPGTRVLWGEKEYPALSPNVVAKKKVWEKEVMNFLTTNANKEACFQNEPWKVNGEVCTVETLTGATIS